MQKYQDSIIDVRGRKVAGVSITVTTYPAGAAATVYSANGITPIVQPIVSDSLGRFSFYAADGRYQLSLSGAGISPLTITDVLLEDPADGGANITLPLGAAALPSLNVVGGNNTGIWFPDVNQVALSTAGIERLRIGATGAISIGGPTAYVGIGGAQANAQRLTLYIDHATENFILFSDVNGSPYDNWYINNLVNKLGFYNGVSGAVFQMSRTGVVVTGNESISGTMQMPALGGATSWVASDKYVVIDSAGNFHRSAIGPAS